MAHGNICDFLREKIKSVLQSKNESLRWLAKQTAIDYSVLYRIQTGDIKSVSFFNAHRLMKHLEPDSYVAILNDFYPDEAREFLGAKAVDTSPISRAWAFERLIADPLHYEVYLKISDGGFNLKQVEAEFGGRGLKAVDNLVQAGAFTVGQDWTFENIVTGYVLANNEDLIKLAERQLALLDLNEPGSFLHSESAGLNAKGIAALYEATQDYKRRLRQIFTDKAFAGNSVAIATVFSGPLPQEGKNP